MVGLCCLKNPRNMSSTTPATSHLTSPTTTHDLPWGDTSYQLCISNIVYMMEQDGVMVVALYQGQSEQYIMMT